MDLLKSRKNLWELILTLILIAIILIFPQIGVLISYLIVIGYLSFRSNRKEKWKSIGFVPPKNVWKLIVITALLGLVIELVIEIFLNPIIEKWTQSGIDLSSVAMNSLGDYLIWVIVGFVLGGFLEEMLFRGFLMTRLSEFSNKSGTGDLLSLIVTSVIFGCCHMYQGWTGVISTGLTGFVLGCIFLKYHKNLWFPIMTHGFINLTALTILYLDYYEVLISLVL